MSLTETQEHNLLILSVTTSVISFIAAISTVMTVFMGSKGFCPGLLRGVKVEKISFHLIAMVSISDAIRTFANMLGSPLSNSGLCGFQTFGKIFGGTASFAWISAITFVMYKLLLAKDTLDKFQLNKYKYRFHVICWLFAFICAIIPTAGGYYENTSGWCFIEHSHTGFLLRLFCYYLWVVILWFIIVICYIRIWKYIKENHVDLSQIPTVKRLMYYPLIFFFCWFWSLLRRGWNVFNADGDAPIIIIGLQIFWSNLYGFCNAMLYGWIVRHHLKAASQSCSDQSKVNIPSNTNTHNWNEEQQNDDDESEKALVNIDTNNNLDQSDSEDDKL